MTKEHAKEITAAKSGITAIRSWRPRLRALKGESLAMLTKIGDSISPCTNEE